MPIERLCSGSEGFAPRVDTLELRYRDDTLDFDYDNLEFLFTLDFLKPYSFVTTIPPLTDYF